MLIFNFHICPHLCLVWTLLIFLKDRTWFRYDRQRCLAKIPMWFLGLRDAFFLILVSSRVLCPARGETFGTCSRDKSRCRFVHGILYDLEVLPKRVHQHPFGFRVAEVVITVVHLLVFADGLWWVAPLHPWLELLSEGNRHNAQWVLSPFLFFFVLTI